MTQSLPTACHLVLPSRARSTEDTTTGTWERAPEHFVLKLNFGKAALTVQDCLQGHIGRAISTAQKAVREAGGTQKTNLFVNRTLEEQERRKGKGNENKGKGKGHRSKGKVRKGDPGAK